MNTEINVPPAVDYLMLKKAYAYRLLKWKGFSLPDFEQLVQKGKIMNIQIKPELEQIIQAQIATGRYTNPEDVISKALKLLLEWDEGYQNWVEETREKVDVSIKPEIFPYKYS